jgi:hypothetical protein
MSKLLIINCMVGIFVSNYLLLWMMLLITYKYKYNIKFWINLNQSWFCIYHTITYSIQLLVLVETLLPTFESLSPEHYCPHSKNISLLDKVLSVYLVYVVRLNWRWWKNKNSINELLERFANMGCCMYLIVQQ